MDLLNMTNETQIGQNLEFYKNVREHFLLSRYTVFNFRLKRHVQGHRVRISLHVSVCSLSYMSYSLDLPKP